MCMYICTAVARALTSKFSPLKGVLLELPHHIWFLRVANGRNGIVWYFGANEHRLYDVIACLHVAR